MKNTATFFIELKAHAGSIWLEDDNIKFSAPKIFHTADTHDFIKGNKPHIMSVLRENRVHSKRAFDDTDIFADGTQSNYPLSPAQERLWFIEQYEDGTNAYHMPMVFELDAAIEVEGIKKALQQIVNRHEILRSRIEQEEDLRTGIQVVHNEPLNVEEVVLKATEDFVKYISDDVNRPFDLSKEYPIRANIVSVLSSEETGISKRLLVVNTHHIASDGMSISIFQNELLAYYSAFIQHNEGFSLPPLSIQYKDYASWQRNFLSGPTLEKQLDYWREKLGGFQTLKLPTDFPRPATIDYNGALESFTLSKELSKKLRDLALQCGSSLHSVMLASMHILLNKYTGQKDIVIGSPIANRTHTQVSELIGFFVNIQANRTILNDSQNFTELIQQIHLDQIEAQSHQDLPFPKLVEELKVERDQSRHPIFQVMFEVQSVGTLNEHSDSQQKYFKPFKLQEAYEVERFDLSMVIVDVEEELLGQISYATSLFDKESIIPMIDHYLQLLEQLSKSPEKPYSQFSILSTEEHQKIVYDWNKTEKEFPRNKSIIEMFEEQAKLNPTNIAVAANNKQLTYQELNEKSNQLAHFIREEYQVKTKKAKKTLIPDTPIVLCLDRSVEMIIGILGVLKAGGAYVPIDPSYPQARVDYMLEDTQAELILTQKYPSQFREIQLPSEKVIHIDEGEEFYLEQPKTNISLNRTGSNLAYIIYTSGTTGMPKGVMVEHQAFSQFIFNFNDFLTDKTNSPKRDTICLTNYVFDIFGLEYALPLAFGSKVTLATIETVKEEYLHDHQIIQQTPSALFQLTKLHPNKLSELTCLVGGEALPTSIAEELIDKFQKVINVYGPAETVIWSSAFEVKDAQRPYIGKPLFNEQFFILDPNNNPVPIGLVGELFIGGMGLARGYYANPKLTEERFISNPFEKGEEKIKGYNKLYKTGDLVRWLPDGNVEYIGRNDDQIKIRGFRIELGEVEKALSKIPSIVQNCVIASDTNTEIGSNKYLVAYYVLEDNNRTETPTSIQNALIQMLPDYMVPNAYIVMDSFPLTVNGKLNKNALPKHEFTVAVKEFVAPVTQTEKELCNTWQEILELDRVGITDNFFELGGTSISAIQVSFQMSKVLNGVVKVSDVFKYKSIDKMINSIQNEHTNYFGLINQYNLDYNHDLPDFIFIHPASAGSEVYQEIADRIASKYNCLGIDNYNVLNKEKIGSLNKLANYYISKYERKFRLGEPIYLFGWSLGGQIALEMAAVFEARGFTNIHIVLLDTHLIYLSNQEIVNNETQVVNDEHVLNILREKKYGEKYIQNVVAAFSFEMELSSSPLSKWLEHSKITLFKASQLYDGADMETTYKQLGFTPANNVDLVAENVEIIKLDCNHLNIIETSGEEIVKHLLSKTFATVPKLETLLV
ncbi:MAG: amino acid adenylation domain-containing protein [Flavobacteriales bacterium]|nr:amino acid adenylation domain-containing protein [Flavobacteriales bacterium]